MTCLSCARGFYFECGHEPSDTKEVLIEESEIRIGRPQKEEVTISGGRKRAAANYELDKDSPCEWRFQANCGGGKFPIVGCKTGKQVNRHHGPVKNTMRNERSNIHLICATCHNRWHAANDAHYNEEEYDLLPHDPREATLEEMLLN